MKNCGHLVDFTDVLRIYRESEGFQWRCPACSAFSHLKNVKLFKFQDLFPNISLTIPESTQKQEQIDVPVPFHESLSDMIN